MQDESGMRRIGYIYACINGDHSYGTAISVWTDAHLIEVRLATTSPDGGMDGPRASNTTDYHVLKRWARKDTSAADVLSFLRKAFKHEGDGVIAKWGKPTKRFAWFPARGTPEEADDSGPGYRITGLTVDSVRRALEWS